MDGETVDGYTYGNECPFCGHDGDFLETCLAHGTVLTDENGDPMGFDYNEFGRAMQVECPECEEVLLDRLN